MLAVEKGSASPSSPASRWRTGWHRAPGGPHPESPLPRQLSLVWHKQKFHSVALRRFLAFCRAQTPA